MTDQKTVVNLMTNPQPINEEPEDPMPTTGLRIEGEAIIYGWDEDQRTIRDHLVKYAKLLGLAPKVREIRGDPTIPSNVRWTLRRVRLDQVMDYILANPGLDYPDLAEVAYRGPDDQWTQALQTHSIGKITVAVTRLAQAGRVKRIIGPNGTKGIYPIDFRPSWPERSLLAPDAVPQAVLEVGVTVLKEGYHLSQRELARQIYIQMRHAARTTP